MHKKIDFVRKKKRQKSLVICYRSNSQEADSDLQAGLLESTLSPTTCEMGGSRVLQIGEHWYSCIRGLWSWAGPPQSKGRGPGKGASNTATVGISAISPKVGSGSHPTISTNPTPEVSPTGIHNWNYYLRPLLSIFLRFKYS